jgi:hypothetical protein
MSGLQAEELLLQQPAALAGAPAGKRCLFTTTTPPLT